MNCYRRCKAGRSGKRPSPNTICIIEYIFLNIRSTRGEVMPTQFLPPSMVTWKKNGQAVHFYREEIDDNLVYHYDKCLELNDSCIEKYIRSVLFQIYIYNKLVLLLCIWKRKLFCGSILYINTLVVSQEIQF